MKRLLGLIVMIVGIGAPALVAAQEGADGAPGAGDPAAVASPNGADDPAPEGEDGDETRRIPAAANAEAKDPFEIPAELLNAGPPNALPDPNRTVEQIKAEAEAAVQRHLAEEERSRNAAGAPQ